MMDFTFKHDWYAYNQGVLERELGGGSEILDIYYIFCSTHSCFKKALPSLKSLTSNVYRNLKKKNMGKFKIPLEPCI